eukprot:CAMPEP_0170539108 /NCGR_PEP_ID=MMETSP0209-20121228/103722_1 /TAXON_ID=665100 ORGANISM="Litonotus pictus, Strain P1" /NCGR_SAMPLE_ID=MMETSP0209 /ASSEMBLY_ACC=CAM_ASM_000301 /LENGTH=88 /DNA_ID=CAMNT_0010840947 /DNA_START=1039 /DNA_END=1301 /DNA_ORIENTATION=-
MKVEDFKKDQRNSFARIKQKLEVEGIAEIKRILRKNESKNSSLYMLFAESYEQSPNSVDFTDLSRQIGPIAEMTPFKFEMDFIINKVP